MNEDQAIDEQEALRSLDRLADGELNDRGRRMLFEWLDGDPARWRRCALLMLETRELQSALGDWMAEAPAPVIGRIPNASPKDAPRSGLVELSSRRPTIRSHWGTLSAMQHALLSHLHSGS